MAEIADELRKACSGHPHAKIAWPHRLLHRAADELDAKDKRIAELEAGGWQDIETAPKEGTWIFLFVPGHGPARARWKDRMGWQCHNTGYEIKKGTHWQPLPAPPFHLPNKEDRNG